MYKVKDNPDLAKDPRSGAVINTNVQAMRSAKERKIRSAAEKERIDQMENDINEMKEMLKAILSKL